MSVRVEVLRFALRRLTKGRDGVYPDVHAIRRNLARIARFIPHPKHVTVSSVSPGGVPALQIDTPRARDGRCILYLHGGAYAYGTPHIYLDLMSRIANAAEARVLGIDYRLAPEHPYPAAVDDAVGAYRWMLTNGADPRRIAIMGDSAGGGLTFAALLRLRDEGVPLPAAAVGLSPWTDLSLSGATIRSNAKADPMLNPDHVRFWADGYLGGADPRTPYASPLFGDPTGLPPALIQVGDDEILRDDAARLADRMRTAGCAVELEVWPRVPHVWHVYARFLREARQAIARIGKFIGQRMDGH